MNAHNALVNHSRKLLATMVSSAIALIAVTNYCIIHLIQTSTTSREQLFSAILPIALPASVAVILVMSNLYHTLQDVLGQLDRRQNDLITRAQQDALTGVGSRELFEDRLAQALARFRRTGERFAVAMLDLDHFKRVNDLHGHQVGDELLRQAAARLKSQLRECDTVARFGGDEFLILQADVGNSASVRGLCERICTELRKSYEISSMELQLRASIGAVLCNKQLGTPADYVRAADVALYEVKSAGRDGYRFFSDKLDEQLRRRDRLETDLRLALKSGDGLSVQYQPQVSAAGLLTGVEALFRWRHDVLGDVPAAEAVEIAEELNMIDMLGEFVFRQAAGFARSHPALSVAVNLSPAQFSRSQALATRMRDLALSEGVQPSQFEFEITERLFMTVGNGSDSQIQSLRDHGFRVALDDFGTGYSSLSYLRRFKVDRLKLDKSFAATEDAQENIALIRAAVSMAHLLKLEVIAEGIETELQETVALESGCDGLQGHRYGSPMTADQFGHYLQARRRNAA
ncbi:MAG TPA: EAL domain-containing protein [Sphingomicrobium sp.]